MYSPGQSVSLVVTNVHTKYEMNTIILTAQILHPRHPVELSVELSYDTLLVSEMFLLEVEGPILTYNFRSTWTSIREIIFPIFYINIISLSVMLLSFYTCIACMPLMFISVLNLIICQSWAN